MCPHRWKLSNVFFIICSIQSFSVLAQLPGSGDGDPFKVSIIPPSPEAAALARYADIPVSLYSGTPNISIPLYEIKERELSLPISLNYHASGNKVETVAPRTGLSWALQAGGVVTRSIRGWPDEYGQNGFLYLAQQHDVGDFALGTPQQQYEWYDAMAEGCLDAEPDLFYFNVAGYTGTFMFDWNGNLQVMSGNCLKIEPQGFTIGALDFIDSWKITVDDGTVFLFQAVESTKITDSSVDISCRLVMTERALPQSWFLTEMRSANQQSWIRFEYESYLQKNEIWALETQVHNQFLSPAPYIKEKLSVNIFGRNLVRITTSSGQCVVQFFPGEQRTDITESSAFTLGQVNIKNINNEPVKHFDLNYGYSTGRLTLTSVVEHTNGIANPPYEFSYYGSLPDPLSFHRDHWGFFNNNHAPTLIPATRVVTANYPDPVELSGADRSPDPYKVLMGMMTQIVYPTGGRDILEFESHDYSFEQNQELNYEITVPRSVTDFAPLSTTPVGSTHTSQRFFTLTARTDVNLVASFGYGITFGGAHFIPSYTITNSAGTVIDRVARGGIVGNDITISKTLYNLPADTYTLTVSAEVPPASLGFPNSVAASLSWQEGTRVIATEIRKGGGVRIAKITRFFGNGNPNKVTKYSYRVTENGQVKSSGSLLESGYVYEKWMDYMTSSGHPSDPSLTETRFFRFSQNKTALGTTNGSHVGYSHVTVLNGESGENGHSIYHYTSSRDFGFQDIPSFEVPFPPAFSMEYRRGLLLDQTDYEAGSNAPVRKVTQDYSYYSQLMWGIKVGMAVPGGGFRGAGFLHRYAVGSYSSPLGYSRLRERRETIFQSNNAPPLETLSTYEYNETTHKQLVRVSTTDSKGETIVTAFKYPHEYTGSSALTTMQNRNMANQVIETLTWKQGSGADVHLLSGVKTEWKLASNKVTPYVKYSANISQPVLTTNPFGTVQNFYEARVYFTDYDAYCNLKEHASKGGVKTSYQWSYAGTMPTAKVENASSRQIFYESFEEDATATTLQQKTGKKSKSVTGVYTVPAASRPDSNGDYILSYWIKVGSNPWVYKEKLIHYSVSTAIATDPVNGYLDEVRVYPKGAYMTTYTYHPLVGITSITDPNNITMYYEYDNMGRLRCIRDHDNNIRECYEYGYRLEIPYAIQD